jgi:CheY-like chemotaxis protein
MEDLLRHAGFKHVYHRGSGAKVLQLIEVLPQVDLVLLDIGLPGEDGFSLIQRLRKHPHTARAHIAAITANIMHQTRLRAKDAGFDSFISKPIRPDRLCEQIRSMLSGRSFWW